MNTISTVGNYFSKIVCLNIRKNIHCIFPSRNFISLLLTYRIWWVKGVLAAWFLVEFSVLWVITPCRSVKANWRFGWPWIFRSWSRQQACCLFHVIFLHDFLFSPEDLCDKFLRNVSWLSSDSYPILCHSLSQKTGFRTLAMKFGVVL